MRIRTRASSSLGPTVLPLVPNVRLCRLEGRNGIGKTLTVRLLELATGELPYRALPFAWRSLKDQLGTVDIDVDELADGLTLRFELTPSEWPDEPDRPIPDALLGKAWKNDRLVTFAEARRDFRTFRVGGEETLRRTVATEVALWASQNDRVLERVRPRRRTWDLLLDQLSQLTFGISEETLAAAVAARRSTELALREAQRGLKGARAVSAVAGDVSRRASALDTLRQRSDGLRDVMAASRAGRDRLAREVTISEANVAAAAAAAVQGEQAKSVLAKAQAGRFARETRFRNALATESTRLREAGLSERPTFAELRSMAQAATDRVNSLQAELDSLDLATPTHSLAAALEVQLKRTLPKLADQVIVSDPPLRVQQVFDGVHRRRLELTGQPVPERVESIRAERLSALRELGAIEKLRSAIESTNRKRELLGEADQAVENLIAAAQAGEAGAYRESQTQLQALWRQLAEFEDQLIKATAEIERLFKEAELPVDLDTFAENGLSRAELGRALMGLTVRHLPEPVLKAIADVNRSPNVDDRWISVIGAIETWTIDVLGLLDAATEALDAADAELTASRREVESLRNRIADASRVVAERTSSVRGHFEAMWGSLSRLGMSPLPESDVQPAEFAAARILTYVHATVERFGDIGTRLLDRGEALQQFLVAASAQIDPGTALVGAGLKPTSIVGVPSLQGWLESELGALFNSEALRRELFDDTQRVDFDFDTLSLIWKSASGAWTRKPLEAFSSGEQAFAYTKARLDDLAVRASGVPHVLVVLDEFGAFVARDRQDHLMRFVELEALAQFAEQAVVMLPLSREMPATKLPREGDGPDVLDSPDEQLAGWDYFCLDALALPALNNG